MEFFKKQPTIPFMKISIPFMLVSLTLSLISVALVIWNGMNYALDFTGGTMLEFSFEKPVELDSVRLQLTSGGYPDAVAQNFGSAHEIIIRVPPRSGQSSAQMSEDIKRLLPDGTANRVEFVGPQVGAELGEQSALALTLSMIGVWLYVLVRFEWRLATAAIVATLHDLTMTAGFVSITHLSFDVTSVAGLLTVVGFSVNDTVVIYDRIRETFRKQRRMTPSEVIDYSVNSTLSRTLMTSLTVMITVLALLFFGGPAMHTFAVIMVVGIFVGTYSSIYIASPVALMLGVQKSHLMPVPKEGAGLESRP